MASAALPLQSQDTEIVAPAVDSFQAAFNNSSIDELHLVQNPSVDHLQPAPEEDEHESLPVTGMQGGSGLSRLALGLGSLSSIPTFSQNARDELLDQDESSERPSASQVAELPTVRRSITQNSANTNRESTASFNEAAGSASGPPSAGRFGR